jgi:putative membrane protein
MTTTPPEAEGEVTPAAATAALGAGRERRLHPLSWLFVLLASLREFALPLIALLFFGRSGGETWEWFGLVGVAALTGLAIVRYFTYRFRIDAGELVIRSGVLHRNVRHVPLGRIQNVALKRNLLHRLAGVAEVRLESAVGGISAEAQMRVLSMRDAHALELLVRAQGASAAAHEGETDVEPDRGDLLLALSTRELVKLGLTSNRGLILGAAGVGVFSQIDSAGLGALVANGVKAAFGHARDLQLGWSEWLFAATVLALAVVAAMRAVSVLLVLLQFHGFRLHEVAAQPAGATRKGGKEAAGIGLGIEAGLLTRIRSHAPLQKIQHWTVRESLLHRLFRRRSLRVETAALQALNEAQSLTDLVPIAAPARIDELLARWLPWLDPDTIDWQPLHPRAWRRMLFWPALLTVLATGLLCLRFGPLGLLALLSLPWWVLRARRLAARSNWAVSERALFWRSGWLDRRLSFAEIGKLQGLQLLQSPFDRRHGMASLVADTAGANPLGHRLELYYLPEAVARELHARLGAQVARSALRW